jgi:ribosomal-protein-serine acetyltransferase
MMRTQAVPLDTGTGVAIVPVTLEHADMLAALVCYDREHLNAWLPMVATLTSPEAALVHLERARVRAEEGEMFEWHLFVGETLCGSVRLKDIDHEERKAAIGYFLGSAFTGQGIITVALQAVLDWGFGPLGLNRVELRCASGNVSSMRVAERLGFVREGLLRQDGCLHGVFVDHCVYGLLQADFKGGGRRGPALLLPAGGAGTPSASLPSAS